MHILLADDDTILSDLLAKYLRGEGLHVTQVFDGKAAVEQVLVTSYDLIILDIMMPEIDGLAALRTIRAHSQTPILMLTARGDDIDRIVGLEMGADDYLPKPCHPRELLARIRAIHSGFGHRAIAPVRFLSALLRSILPPAPPTILLLSAAPPHTGAHPFAPHGSDGLSLLPRPCLPVP
jgi:DNA-binding response OmpR family regulator